MSKKISKSKLRLIHKNAPFPKEKINSEDILTKQEKLEFLREHLKTLNTATRRTRALIKEIEEEIKFEKKRKPR